ncbi:phosphohydrolase [Jeotgalibacillus proteolyticus]|uniref:Phosphohydrolase n=1 Tax=Jeotgalibacillus proteolyticus TaxID=2082395 RepID=A0A2S5GFV2_9BACL|nr:phosphohydrolase [Jeotgalibacillus proteolyticus]
MINKSHILLAEKNIRPFFERDHSGHDWDHIQRVRRTALFLCEKEGCSNFYTVDLIALLHDAGDVKLHPDENKAEQALKDAVLSIGLSGQLYEDIITAVQSVSFNGGNEKPLPSLEAAIVRDADRLDAIGAIGIARAFAYGGAKGAKLYDKDVMVRQTMSEKEYRAAPAATINHFYEKLFKIKDLMVTEAGKKEAIKRHKVMKSFVEQFLIEWKGQG